MRYDQTKYTDIDYNVFLNHRFHQLGILSATRCTRSYCGSFGNVNIVRVKTELYNIISCRGFREVLERCVTYTH